MQDAISKILIYGTVLVAMTFAATGCANVAVTGAEVVYNHKRIENKLNDQYITMRANQMINNIDKSIFADANISVSTVNSEVLLTGEAPKVWQKEEATRLVMQLPRVKRIYNLITISNPSSALTRISDAWITTKVKGRIIASNDIDATKVKVITENGRVFLMGTMLPDQATEAVEIARTTDGVKSVVKVFKYIKITDTI